MQNRQHVCGGQKVTRSPIWLDQSECSKEVTGAKLYRILKAVLRNFFLTERVRAMRF